MTNERLRELERLAADQPQPVKVAVLELVAEVQLLQRRQQALTREVDRVLDQAPGTFGKHWPYDLP